MILKVQYARIKTLKIFCVNYALKKSSVTAKKCVICMGMSFVTLSATSAAL